MSGGEIILDAETFKALSSQTRIKLLKILGEHKTTLTDLSNRMGLSKTTVQFHLDSLMEVGLIRKEDGGRKWLYYSLTKKGRAVLDPDGRRIRVILSLSVGLITISILALVAYALGGGVHWAADVPFESFLANWQLVVGVVAMADANILLLCSKLLRRPSRRFVEVMLDEE